MDYEASWQFCVATGMFAEVSARTEGRYQDQAFTAGVLHQVGVLALDQFRGDLLRSVMERSAGGASRQDAEREVLGFTTTALGGGLAEHWGFPPDLVSAIGGQTRPIDELAAEGGLAGTVARARLYARAYGMADGITSTEQTSPPEEWASGPLSVSLRQAGGMETILERVDAFMAAAAA